MAINAGIRRSLPGDNMIIKEPDDKGTQIAQLEQLLQHPKADAATKKRIEQEIRNIRAGMKGESEAAYEMKVYLSESKNTMVIHDLRIEHNGLVAQIDHLLVNRFLDFLVCESKNFSEGVSINEHGEFNAFFHSKPYGVPSPIEQNKRHIAVLQKLLASGAVDMPRRLGFALTPALESYVLVSKGARITRPKNVFPGLEAVMKNDQFMKALDSRNEGRGTLALAKLISSETLEALANQIAALHKPGSFDFAAKFGLPSGIAPINPIAKSVQSELAAPKLAMQAKAVEAPVAPVGADGGQVQKPKLVCHACSTAVTYAVGKFCWMNKPKFGGNVFCMDCQKIV